MIMSEINPIENLKIGMKYRSERIVTEDTTATVFDSGALPVYSTPAMLALMEGASWHMVKDVAGLDTVGTLVNIQHLRACKVGAKVWAEAELVAIDGRKLSFNVVASDDKGEIGKGYHERFIVDPDRFMSKL